MWKKKPPQAKLLEGKLFHDFSCPELRLDIPRGIVMHEDHDWLVLLHDNWMYWVPRTAKFTLITDLEQWNRTGS